MIWSVAGSPADGAQQPVAPGARLVGVAGVEQREQRERGVAQPAVAVVPVAHAAELLGQRGRRRGDDPAGRRVGERLERDQRADDCLAPLALVGAAVRPSRRHHVVRVAAAPLGVDRVRRRGSCDGYQVRTNGTRSPSRTVNSADRAHVLAADARPACAARARPGRRSRCGRRRSAATHGTIGRSRSGSRAPSPSSTSPRRPSTMRTRSGASPRGGMKSITRTAPSSVSNSVSSTSVSRAVAAARLAQASSAARAASGRARRAEQRGEAGAGVEAREAEPVDRAVAADERRGLAVADQRVVLDPRHQRSSISSAKRGSRFATARLNACLVLLGRVLVERRGEVRRGGRRAVRCPSRRGRRSRRTAPPPRRGRRGRMPARPPRSRRSGAAARARRGRAAARSGRAKRPRRKITASSP